MRPLPPFPLAPSAPPSTHSLLALARRASRLPCPSRAGAGEPSGAGARNLAPADPALSGVDDFTQQPEVINGCSDLLGEIFGERGTHARSAVGTNSLPRQVPVEIELIVEVEN